MACRCLLLTSIASLHVHATLPPFASMSKPLGAAELPLARVEFVEKSVTYAEQHDPLLVELAGGRRIAVSLVSTRQR